MIVTYTLVWFGESFHSWSVWVYEQSTEAVNVTVLNMGTPLWILETSHGREPEPGTSGTWYLRVPPKPLS